MLLLFDGSVGSSLLRTFCRENNTSEVKRVKEGFAKKLATLLLSKRKLHIYLLKLIGAGYEFFKKQNTF
jgi:hypothetical protein